MPTKVCFKCGEEKPLDDFYKHSEMADGHLNKCKECTKKDVAENYAKRREYYSQYERERNKKPRRRTYKRRKEREHRIRHPEKARARQMVSNAVRDGRISKPDTCEECGRSDVRLQAHHEDYSKPLDVRWLCFRCHRAEHGQVTVAQDPALGGIVKRPQPALA